MRAFEIVKCILSLDFYGQQQRNGSLSFIISCADREKAILLGLVLHIPPDKPACGHRSNDTGERKTEDVKAINKVLANDKILMINDLQNTVCEEPIGEILPLVEK